MILLSHITKTFQARGVAQAVNALDDVSLEVSQGAIYGIIGRSGAGKSTLIRLINGLDKPTSGSVNVNGVEISGLTEKQLRVERQHIGMIFQHFNLLSSRTVAQNIALPLELIGTPKAEIARRVHELLDLVGLEDKRDRYPAELSGGQKQRVGIARALATNPRVLLCDEATSALDPETTRSILELIQDINRTLGLTVVLITHEMSVIKEICHRVAVLEAGRLVEEGSVIDVFSTPQHPTTRSFLGGLVASALPDYIEKSLLHTPTNKGSAILRIVFSGDNATTPVIARLAQVGIEANILQGQVDNIGGVPSGTLVVAVSAQDMAAGAAQAIIKQYDLKVEHLGYVA